MKHDAPVLSAEEVFAYLEEVFPAVRGRFVLEDLGVRRARMRMKVAERDIRPGGTISGPAMFELADCAFYVAAMAMIGREALTVTTTATINFLNKPPQRDMVCDVRLLKQGKLLITGDALIRSVGDDRPMAHATMTYAVPPRPQGR